MDSRYKLLEPQALGPWRAAARAAGKTVVVTNGCFDLLHAGHVAYLEAARSQGDLLLVGLNSDDSVRQLKGPERPLNVEQDRARVLAALEAVDAVCFFGELRATRFLERAQPDIYVKGGDFRVEDLPAEERAVVAGCGGRILTLALVPGRSTTGLLERIREDPSRSVD
jgi:rfaE bifunctional protein nucleotidyltransferase chain/domain